MYSTLQIKNKQTLQKMLHSTIQNNYLSCTSKPMGRYTKLRSNFYYE